MNKRDVLSLMMALPWLGSCANQQTVSDMPASQRRFAGIGCVLVVDAVKDAAMEGATFYSDRGHKIFAKANQTYRNKVVKFVGGIYFPQSVRVIWRESPKVIWGNDGDIDFEGRIIGDYKISVGERIPDEVLADIRSRGGALRLKFRLKPDGVMFGWDIERDSKTARVRDPYGGPFTYEMPGGDFKEADFYNGKVVVNGWYINELGQKVETNY